jgi:hypothetical protein
MPTHFAKYLIIHITGNTHTHTHTHTHIYIYIQKYLIETKIKKKSKLNSEIIHVWGK